VATTATAKLEDAVTREPLLIGDLILLEILQGARDEVHADYPTRPPARQPISQKSASSRVASLKITISSASRAGVR